MRLSCRDKHHIMKAITGEPGMAMGKELTRPNGDCGVDKVNSVSERTPPRTGTFKVGKFPTLAEVVVISIKPPDAPPRGMSPSSCWTNGGRLYPTPCRQLT